MKKLLALALCLGLGATVFVGCNKATNNVEENQPAAVEENVETPEANEDVVVEEEAATTGEEEVVVEEEATNEEAATDNEAVVEEVEAK